MHIPVVDMVQVSRNSRDQRNKILQFNPPGLKIVDYSAIRRLDTFFLDCQNYRDYYRDPDDKLQQPSRFLNQGPCGIKPDHATKDLLKPVEWVTRSKPVYNFVENTPKLDMDMNRSPESLMRGHYDAGSCTRFKR